MLFGGGGIVTVPVLALVVPATPARVAAPALPAAAEPVVVVGRAAEPAAPGVVLPLATGRGLLAALPAEMLPTPAGRLPGADGTGAEPTAPGVRTAALPAAFGPEVDDPTAAGRLAVMPDEADALPALAEAAPGVVVVVIAVAVVRPLTVPAVLPPALMVANPSPPGPAHAVSTLIRKVVSIQIHVLLVARHCHRSGILLSFFLMETSFL